jgi:hypothetical protein
MDNVQKHYTYIYLFCCLFNFAVTNSNDRKTETSKLEKMLV